MNNTWNNCKNILVIRADNMGDLLMSSPAIRALKNTFQAKITVLTSSLASGIAPYIPEIDELITHDLPWVKTAETTQSAQFFNLINELKDRKFDGAVIFSVYSQNPLPAAMLAYLSGIPLRLAYCRENPYDLITDWVPDREPYTEIKHQVRRDLDLVGAIGALADDELLTLQVPESHWSSACTKLIELGVDLERPWLIVHAGVSEKKRQYPFDLWVETARNIVHHRHYQVLFTGGPTEKKLTDDLQVATGAQSFSIAGLLSLPEFVQLIDHAPLVISVNTGTIHLAAAVNTPLVVLYALTNPQHFPWKASGKVLTFDVEENLKSKNEVIRFVNECYFSEQVKTVEPAEILEAASTILAGNIDLIPELPENLLRLA
jgi:lipopolysaccharide heptosyltransferase II